MTSRVVESTSTGGLISGEWQLQRGSLLVGDSTRFDIVGSTGLGSLPAVVASDTNYVRRDGAAPGLDFLGPRSFTVSLEVVDEEDSSLNSKLDTLTREFMPGQSETGLGLQLPGVAGGAAVFTSARVRRREVRHDLRLARGVARVELQLLATDPRLYSPTLGSSEVSAASTASVGSTFDQTFGLSFGGAITPGSVTVTNGGSYAAPATYRITGPVTDPVVTNNTTGESFSLTVTLASGTYVDVDTLTRTILYQGSTNYYSKLDSGSTLFDLAPGANELRLTRTGSDAATLTVYHRDTYL